MDSDLALVLGLLFVWLAIPAFVSVFANQRRSVVPLVLLIGGVALMLLGYFTHPGGYAPATVPDVIIRVIGRFLS